ncbi:hypothetical protein BaRGS_00009348 [Batillaria attramentaria]|uniref:Uncharacterized protein n=1 Tax=Batillaria attramentaria TaxID=370345 RepID=A0ABD0LIX6_9CAEN
MGKNATLSTSLHYKFPIHALYAYAASRSDTRATDPEYTIAINCIKWKIVTPVGCVGITRPVSTAEFCFFVSDTLEDRERKNRPPPQPA